MLTLAGSHPAREVRDLAGQLEVELAATLNRTGWFILDLLRSRDVESLRGKAILHRAEALRLLDGLLAEIHKPETGRRRLGRLSQRGQLPG